MAIDMQQKNHFRKRLTNSSNHLIGYIVSGVIGQSDNKSHCYLAVNDSDLHDNLKQLREIQERGSSAQSVDDDTISHVTNKVTL